MNAIADLVGKTVLSIDGATKGSESITFRTDDGDYRMYHYESCCESVDVEDICGDVADLIGSPIVRAEEPSSVDGVDPKKALNGYEESFTWTFYILGTAKGTVTIRWYGSSNGYYGEAPWFERVTP